MQLSRSVAIFDEYACSYYIYGYSYKGMLTKSIPLAACAWLNRAIAYDIAIRKN